MLKKNVEKVARVIVGISTNKAKVNINLAEIFAPSVPFFLSTRVWIIFLITLKQSPTNKITSIDNVAIAIVGVIIFIIIIFFLGFYFGLCFLIGEAL